MARYYFYYVGWSYTSISWILIFTPPEWYNVANTLVLIFATTEGLHEHWRAFRPTFEFVAWLLIKFWEFIWVVVDFFSQLVLGSYGGLLRLFTDAYNFLRGPAANTAESHESKEKKKSRKKKRDKEKVVPV